MKRSTASTVLVGMVAALVLSACGSSETATTNAPINVAGTDGSVAVVDPAPSASAASSSSPTPSASTTTDPNDYTNNPEAAPLIEVTDTTPITTMKVDPAMAAKFADFGGAEAMKYAFRYMISLQGSKWTDSGFFNRDEFDYEHAVALLRPLFNEDGWSEMDKNLKFVYDNYDKMTKLSKKPEGTLSKDEKSFMDRYLKAYNTLRSFFLFDYSLSGAQEYEFGAGTNPVLAYTWDQFKYNTYPSPDGKGTYLVLTLTTNTFLKAKSEDKYIKVVRTNNYLLEPTVGTVSADNSTGTQWKIAGWLGPEYSISRVNSLPGG